MERDKQFETNILKGFLDYHETIECIITEGDTVWIRDTLTRAHRGDYRGLAPTSKKITGTRVAILRIVNGNVVER